MSYDEYGNLTRSFDAADDGTADDVEAHFEYTAADQACRDRNIIGIARVVWENRATPFEYLRYRESTVDCASGSMTQLREFLAEDVYATTDLEYYPDGNLKSVTGPENKTGQRYKLDYGYDTVVGVHIESIVDSFGYRSSSTHNLKYGLADRTVDQNNQQVLRSYDTIGRLKTVTGPYEAGTGRVTIDMEYHPEAAVPYAVTRHADRAATGLRTDTIDTVSFVDGLRQVVQTKKDASVAATPGATPAAVMIVSGRTKVDLLGRIVEIYQPVTEAKGSANTAFSSAFDSLAPTRDSFDVLDRKTKTVLPDNTTTQFAFGFAPDRGGVTRFEKTGTDANGRQRRTYTDVRELTTAVKEFNPSGGQPVVWTSYDYNPLGELTTVTDDKNNVTRAEYDGFGRRTVIDSPDNGRTETRYDMANNITARITANLRAADKQVEFDYDYTRLKGLRYPTFPANNVSYTYGAPGAADNTADRISEVRDAAGTVTRGYGALGELTREIRTVTLPNQAAKSFTTRWAYDSFNRVLQLTYPDNEVLTYDYDTAGLINKATGVKNGSTYTYVARLDYDKFGQRLLQETGTGVRTTYAYDPADRQLATLKSKLANGTSFQDISYTRDKTGNITKLTNAAPAGAIGGPSTQTFGYDELYRLTSASGEYIGGDSKPNRYTLAMGYDSIHNATSKVQTHTIAGSLSQFALSSYDQGQPMGPIEPVEDPSNPAEVQDKTSYTYPYTYNSGKPHAPSQVGPITHGYDANGNLTDTVNTATAPAKRRQYVWDEDNRLACNDDHATSTVAQDPTGCANATVKYLYDAKGDRVVKQGDGTTIYPNNNYSERDGTGYKHIFIGDNRLTTKTVNTSGSVESDQYYFHADHIGSAGYLTNSQGQLTEHLEYFPFGETWVEEHAGGSTGAPIPYKFTGKEQDEETGLNYHGARYYNPRTQLWASPDPALPDYFDSKVGSGGIHEPRNLAAYTYVHNDPLELTDPDGRLGMPKMPKIKMPSKETLKNIGHTALDVAGMVPVVGEAADVANAGWYLAEGDKTNAALSLAGAIPGAGNVATAAKLANKAVKAADNAADAAKATDKAVDAAKAAPNPPAKAGAPKPDSGCNSFTGDTPVLMADGSHKPIAQVVIGDLVIAADPETGEAGARVVTALILGQGLKNLVEIAVATGGTVIATEGHPFWVPDLREWIDAGDVAVGMLLQTGSGSYVQVTAVKAWTQSLQVHNLTVDDLHTYYVAAGATDLLVHNDSCPRHPVPNTVDPRVDPSQCTCPGGPGGRRQDADAHHRAQATDENKTRSETVDVAPARGSHAVAKAAKDGGDPTIIVPIVAVMAAKGAKAGWKWIRRGSR